MNNWSNIMAQANAALLDMNSILVKTKPLPFGCDLAFADPHAVVHSTVCSRLLKKFEKPDDNSKDRLKDLCESKWIEYEEMVCKTYTPYHSMSSSERSAFYHQRLNLRSMLETYVSPFGGLYTDRIRKLECSPLDFTPGETYHSLNGNVSLEQKLGCKECYTVTADAIDDATLLILSHRGLLTACLNHIPKDAEWHVDLGMIYKTLCIDFKSLLRKKGHTLNHLQLLLLIHLFKQELKARVRFFKYRALFCNYVFTVVDGSRGSSVPKNNETERFINIEPMFNMLLQRIVAAQLRKILKQHDNDLEFGQQDHKLLISQNHVATLDLKSGSDSTMLKYITWALEGMDICRDLLTTRSNFTWLGRNLKNYFQTAKLSAMGNGFTFEIMTCVLLSACRLFDPKSRVYGDDIIIANRHTNALIPLLRNIGYHLNFDKTFVNSTFRESCGAFYSDHLGYITCYDLHWIENVQDLFVTVNKLRRIIDAYDYEWIDIIAQTWTNIVSLIPLCNKGPDACVNDFGVKPIVDTHVVVKNSLRKKRQAVLDAGTDLDYLRLTLQAQEVVAALQLRSHDVEFLKCIQLQSKLASKPSYDYVGKGRKRRRYIVARDNFQVLAWLNAGRVVKDISRTSPDKYRFSEVVCVSIQGCTPFPLKKWLQPYS